MKTYLKETERSKAMEKRLNVRTLHWSSESFLAIAPAVLQVMPFLLAAETGG